MQDKFKEVSDSDWIILGKLLVDLASHNGMPLTPEGFTKERPKIAKALGVEESELTRTYQLLFSLCLDYAANKPAPVQVKGFFDRAKEVLKRN